MNIQSEVEKIHSQYGTSELSNYKIQLLFEKYCEEQTKKLSDFATKTGEMRKAQRQYFKSNHDRKYLERSKELEKEVDGLVDVVLNPQTSLF